MNDLKRTVLWTVFALSLVMLWSQWQRHQGQPASLFPFLNSSAPAPTSAASASNAVPNAVATSGGGAAATLAQVAEQAKTVAGERITVNTDVMRLTFNTVGGTLMRVELTQHADHNEGAAKNAPLVLLDETKDKVYVAQSGLIGASGESFPTHTTPMKWVSSERSFAAGSDELVVKFEAQNNAGITLVKTYTLTRGAYDIKVKHEIINNGTTAVHPQLYLQLVRDGNKPPGESAFISTFTGPALYTEADKFHKINFEDIEKNAAEFTKQADNGYVAMVQHYFASAWVLAQGTKREFFARRVDNNLYSVGMVAPLPTLNPGTAQAVNATLFTGPQEEKKLQVLAPGLELVKDYGWLTILSKPLYKLLDFLHGLLGNWGWAIVALVVLLKLAFYWLNAKAYQSMAKMKAINPRIMKMRETHKDNPQKMQQEMIRMYREEKVNPLGGCFPIAIQIPVFIALYWVLLSSVEMRNAPWIGWIHDLSARDPYYILPILMTASTLLQTWLNPTPPDPLQAKIMWIMPLVFSGMFFFFPAGLVLYWLVNNILSIAQQWVINRRMGIQ